jgi:hypothetical protein
VLASGFPSGISLRYRNSKFQLGRQTRKELLYRVSDQDGNLKIVVPASFRERLLKLSHYPVTSGHPGSRKMYSTLSQKYYLTGLPLDVTRLVNTCHHFKQESTRLRKRKQGVTLFPASDPLDFVEIDLLVPLPKSPRGNQFLLVMCDRSSKLVRTVPLRSITSLAVAQAFCSHWVFVYGMPQNSYLITGVSLIPNSFKPVASSFESNRYLPPPIILNATGRWRDLVGLFYHNYEHMSENIKMIGIFTMGLTFAHNNQIHTGTGVTPF